MFHIPGSPDKKEQIYSTARFFSLQKRSGMPVERLDEVMGIYAIIPECSSLESESQLVWIERTDLDFSTDRDTALNNRVSVNSFRECDEPTIIY